MSLTLPTGTSLRHRHSYLLLSVIECAGARPAPFDSGAQGRDPGGPTCGRPQLPRARRRVAVIDALVQTVVDGPFVLAALVAAAAGLVSFLSPCCLPLVPGYVSYMTGLTGAELEAARVPATAPVVTGTVLAPPTPTAGVGRWSSVLAGSVLFVLGFSAVFVTAGAAFGGIGAQLLAYQDTINRVAGGLTIVLGLGFLGAVPALQRELRVHRLPQVGVAGAPLLGVVFGVGWTPCLGPTLAVVQTMAFTQGTAVRGAALTFAYCLGLGLPFILTALAFRRAMTVFSVVKRHYALVTRAGGALLVAVGVLLLTGGWTALVVELRGWVSGFAAVL